MEQHRRCGGRRGGRHLSEGDRKPPVGPVDPPSPPAGPLGRLTISGVNFVDAGRPWKYRAVTAFTLLQDFTVSASAGVDLLRWATDIGANTVRVFGMWGDNDPHGSFDPRRTDSYYQALDVFCGRLQAFGFRLHFVAFTDQVPGSSVLMSPDEQANHLGRVVKVLYQHDNVLLEYVNEDWKNGSIAYRWLSTNEVLTTRSSWEDGRTPLEAGSLLDYTTEHTPRGAQWERKAKNLLETSRQGLGDFPATGKPAIAGEPERLENATPRQYADYMAVAELFASGACLHGLGLERCQIPADDSVARAVAAVWADPPPADLAAAGEYTRGGLDTCPLVHRDRYDDDGNLLDDSGALRTFAMAAGARATAVIVSPGPNWQLEPRNGWRVARQHGFEGNIVDLER